MADNITSGQEIRILLREIDDTFMVNVFRKYISSHLYQFDATELIQLSTEVVNYIRAGRKEEYWQFILKNLLALKLLPSIDKELFIRRFRLLTFSVVEFIVESGSDIQNRKTTSEQYVLIFKGLTG